MNIISLSVLCVFTGSAWQYPAHADSRYYGAQQAQSPFKGGMNYTAVRRANEENIAPTAAPAPAPSSAPAPARTAPNTALNQKTTTRSPATADTAPASNVWKKYKALAMGQADTTTPQDAQPQYRQPSQPPIANTPDINNPVPPTIPLPPSVSAKYNAPEDYPSVPVPSVQAPPAHNTQQPAATKPAGIGALLQQYEQNKTQRSQMRTIRAPQPTADIAAPAQPATQRN